MQTAAANAFRLPVGYRFSPTDDELISHYLMNKIKGNPLPSDAIRDCDLYGGECPWDIFPRSAGTDRCFAFTKLTKISQKKVSRTTACGEWHGNNRGVEILDKRNNVIGVRKQFCFKVKNKKNKGKKGATSTSSSSVNAADNGGSKAAMGGSSGWVMHEYSLSGLDSDYVLCEILNSERNKWQGVLDQNNEIGERKSLVAEDQNNPRASAGTFGQSGSSLVSEVNDSGEANGVAQIPNGDEVEVPESLVPSIPEAVEAHWSINWETDHHLLVESESESESESEPSTCGITTVSQAQSSSSSLVIVGSGSAEDDNDNRLPLPHGSEVELLPSSLPPATKTPCSFIQDIQDLHVVPSENNPAASGVTTATDLHVDESLAEEKFSSLFEALAPTSSIHSYPFIWDVNSDAPSFYSDSFVEFNSTPELLIDDLWD